MHIGDIKTADCANGIGMRVTIFVSGCTNHCKGCFQPETWDFEFGKEWTSEHEDYVISELSKSYYSGLTILGGEPFEPSSQEVLVGLIKRIREELPNKNIWMFTGNVYERDLLPGCRKYTDYTDDILDNIDVLVDGPFVESKKSLTLKFRGSSNQRLIDMPATRAAGEVILLDL
ncbi:MAG: anaerobic ribonucleoside-triphosphate reductase activating protein [Firmicutes bacterium]|nr:anaerobic ribonucleoside-triphosphate reductase activating protein [Bacillota bacterium]